MRRPIGRSTAGLMLAAACLSACSARARTAAPAGSPSPAPAAGASPAAAPAGSISLTDPQLKVVADRARGGGLEEVIIYGDGTVFRDGRTQFKGGRELVQKVVALIEEARFLAMPESFSGGDRWGPHHLRLQTSSGVHEVHQVWLSEATIPFELLVRRILALTGPPEGSVSVSDLSDGLRKVAAGELAPQALALVAVRQSEGSASQAHGWTLRLEDGALSRAEIQAGAHRPAAPLPISPERIRELAGQLTAHGIEHLPANLYAPDYTHITVRVLGFSKDVLARRFTGMTGQSHGSQAQFDQLFALLEGLAGAGPPT